MPYTVLARKWRPQRFDEVVGQRAVTETLRNAIRAGRVAQAFLFAGPRGVGKTTTARILARALNCVSGPAADPCGTCDACVEIAEGRDIDVLEIDAATHTQVDKVREIIIAGLGMAPVRNRYRVFIIDEVHRLSAQAFDALLKSIEEPPAHVVFMMATTELDKVPDTIQSRAQVFELKVIAARAILEQLRTVADAEQVTVDDAALALIARAAEGSMRDAQSALDQVIAFAGQTIAVEDVSAVLGLVGRELLFDMTEAVAAEDAARVFELAGRAVEAGYDLRLVCRELARLARDLLVLSIDPARLEDPEIAPEAERPRLRALAGRFSREDLMRAFDVLARAEQEIRASAQPRYHLEMALLRWIHLRQLAPLSEVIESLQASGGAVRSGPGGASRRPAAGNGPPAAGFPAGPDRPAPAVPAPSPLPAPGRATAAAPAAPEPAPVDTEPDVPAEPATDAQSGEGAGLKPRLLQELQRTKKFFYGTVVAQAQRIDEDGERLTFTFAPAHRTLRAQLEQARAWLEPLASRLAGRTIAVAAVQAADAVPPAPAAAPAGPSPDVDLKEKALADKAVQAMLSIFPAEIKDVEEL